MTTRRKFIKKALMRVAMILPPSIFANSYKREKRGEIIQLIDSYTKENVSYEETFVWHDGSPMNDSKVDNVIYRKKNNKYYVDCSFIAGDPLNVRRFGVLGRIDQDKNYVYNAIVKVKDLALTFKRNIYFPEGIYDIGNKNYPFRQSVIQPVELLDMGNITIFGDNHRTILKTTSNKGADVLQLNAIKNFHIRDIAITADLTSWNDHGSNGISITAGYDNISIKNVHIYDLPFVKKRNYVDGGKALTIQSNSMKLEHGKIYSDVTVSNCVYGFGVDLQIRDFMSKKSSAEINIVADKCYRGIVISTINPSDESDELGYKINANLTNCQQDVILGRVQGVDLNCVVLSTQSLDELRKNVSGTTWSNDDKEVLVVRALYIKNSSLHIYGKKLFCDYKVKIGGAYTGTSVVGYSSNNNLYFDVSGQAVENDIVEIDFGGNSTKNNTINISKKTTENIPASFFLEHKNNIIFHKINN